MFLPFDAELLLTCVDRNVLQGGAYVDTNNLPFKSDIKTAVVNEMLARAINDLWASLWTYDKKNTKIWVSFADLQDDEHETKCKGDIGGPQSTKYCADGGVYYLYRFQEDGNHKGHLVEPRGMKDLVNYRLDPKVRTGGS